MHVKPGVELAKAAVLTSVVIPFSSLLCLRRPVRAVVEVLPATVVPAGVGVQSHVAIPAVRATETDGFGRAATTGNLKRTAARFADVDGRRLSQFEIGDPGPCLGDFGASFGAANDARPGRSRCRVAAGARAIEIDTARLRQLGRVEVEVRPAPSALAGLAAYPSGISTGLRAPAARAALDGAGLPIVGRPTPLTRQGDSDSATGARTVTNRIRVGGQFRRLDASPYSGATCGARRFYDCHSQIIAQGENHV